MLRQMRVDVPRDTIMVMGGRIVWRFYKVPRQAVHKNQLTGPCSCHKVPRQAVIKISSRDPCGGNISFYDTEILALGSDRSLLCLECLFSRNLAVPYYTSLKPLSSIHDTSVNYPFFFLSALKHLSLHRHAGDQPQRRHGHFQGQTHSRRYPCPSIIKARCKVRDHAESCACHLEPAIIVRATSFRGRQ